MVREVKTATSARSLTTLDTVAMDTPAALAITARVGRLRLRKRSAPSGGRSAVQGGRPRAVVSDSKHFDDLLTAVARRTAPREAPSARPVKDIDGIR